MPALTLTRPRGGASPIAADLAALDRDFERAFSSKYGRVYFNAEKKVAICVATQPYIPITEFKKLFNRIGKVVQAHGIEKLVFDKRHLKSFHQPSMEWYFVSWKEEMINYGLTQHRKLLPQEKWFEQSVKAGRAMIAQKFPQSRALSLDIQYTDTLADAIER